jgi:hypothetical protein
VKGGRLEKANCRVARARQEPKFGADENDRFGACCGKRADHAQP